jgi:lysyl endopeptidase
MTTRRIAAGAALLTLTLLAGCASREAAPVPQASATPPEGCGKNFPPDTPLLKLDRTETPKTSAQKSQPFQFANQIEVDSELQDEGAWTDYTDGWSSLTLRLSSENAKSMALHLTRLELPERAQVWFCSADGHLRQGPYREAAGGELWTPVVLGAEARLQIDVPTLDKAGLKGEIAEAFGGFR